MLYVSNPRVVFPLLLREFHAFGSLSDLKINSHKSEVLNVTLSTAEVAHLTMTSRFPFPWQRVALTYLGNKLPSDTSLIYELNYKPLLVAMTCKLCEWVTPSHSWFGRMALFKMDILPRILCFSDGPHVGSQNLFPHI